MRTKQAMSRQSLLMLRLQHTPLGEEDLVRPAQVFTDAAHLINIPLLKGHGPGHASLGMKNHC